MIEIICHECQKPLEIPKHINPERFDGEIFCRNCESWWRIKLIDSKVEKMVFVRKQQSFNFTKLVLEKKESGEKGKGK